MLLGKQRAMKNKALKIGDYQFSKTDNLLLDANIWLYLFPPPSSPAHHATRIYSAAFKLMKDANSKIMINALILSEYLNRYCRIEWNALHRQKYPDYKNFRQSEDYNAVGKNATAFARVILKNSVKVDDEFTSANTGAIMANFESGALDFNDSMVTDVCLRRSWT